MLSYNVVKFIYYVIINDTINYVKKNGNKMVINDNKMVTFHFGEFCYIIYHHIWLHKI